MDYIHNAEQAVKTKLDVFLTNPYIMAVLKITLILYASTLAPKAPAFVISFFQYTPVKLVAVVLIAYLANIDFQLSILLAIIFVLGSNFLSGKMPWETFSLLQEEQGSYFVDKTKYTNLLGQPATVNNSKLLDGQTDVYSSCTNIKLQDLLNVFDGNAQKLQDTVSYSTNYLMQNLPDGSDAKTKLTMITKSLGLPYNVELNETNAPLIATILINAGYKVTDLCRAPFQDSMINQ
jgi:hypothetical protein